MRLMFTARLALASVALVLGAGSAAAQTLPKFTGFVVDAANVLPPDVEAALTAKLDALQKDTNRQLVVATIPDLQGYPIEDYGNRLIRGWGVGLKDVNNGAILIVAPNDRKVRIEVGYGLEPFLTDALSSVVINQQILPRFKAGDMPGGIVAGTDVLVQQLRAAPEEAQARTDAAVAEFNKASRGGASGGGGGLPIGMIFWGMVLAFVLLSLGRGGRRGRGRRYRGGGGGNGALPIILWSIANEIGREASRGGGSGGWGSGGGGGSGGGWGGGFGGGGGGSGGGGGASGSW